MTTARIMGLLLSLCGGCAGCYESSSPAEDSGIDFDASPADVRTVDASDPLLDPESLRSCGSSMTTDSYPIETVSDGCERYLGSLGFAHASVTDSELSVLGSLRWIDGGLGLVGNGELTSLASLERLEHVGRLHIRSSYHIDDLAPLGRLRTVEDLLYISDNWSLGSLHGLERLERVGGKLILNFHPEYRDGVSLELLESLRLVGGDVDFRNVRREQVDAFLARVEVGGTVTLDGEVIVPSGGDAEP